MTNLMNDFGIFLNFIWTYIENIFNWLFSTWLGELLIFTIIITLFLVIINLIIKMKD